MEKDIDLTGVDPARWPEIRRRVAILEEFALLRRPPAEVRQHFAQRIGLSVSQFMHLARVWRNGKCAADITGARSRIDGQKSRRIPLRSVEIMREVIDDLGVVARRKDVLSEVVSRCESERIKPPSNSTVSNMLAEARAAANDEVDLEPEMLIDEISIKLPVITDKDIVMPRVLVAFILPQRRIVAAEISCDQKRPTSTARLMKAIQEESSDGGLPLRLRAPHCAASEREAIGALSRDKSVGLPALGRILGNTLGDLKIIYQASKARPGSRLVDARHAAPIGPEDAERAIRRAINTHNAKVPDLPLGGFSLITVGSP